MIHSTIFNHSSTVVYSMDETAGRGEGMGEHSSSLPFSFLGVGGHNVGIGGWVWKDSFTPDDTCSAMPHYSSKHDDHTSNSTKFSAPTHFSFSLSSSFSLPSLKLTGDYCSVQAQVVDSGTSSCPSDKSRCQRHEECLNRCI